MISSIIAINRGDLASDDELMDPFTSKILNVLREGKIHFTNTHKLNLQVNFQ